MNGDKTIDMFKNYTCKLKKVLYSYQKIINACINLNGSQFEYVNINNPMF